MGTTLRSYTLTSILSLNHLFQNTSAMQFAKLFITVAFASVVSAVPTGKVLETRSPNPQETSDGGIVENLAGPRGLLGGGSDGGVGALTSGPGVVGKLLGSYGSENSILGPQGLAGSTLNNAALKGGLLGANGPFSSLIARSATPLSGALETRSTQSQFPGAGNSLENLAGPTGLLGGQGVGSLTSGSGPLGNLLAGAGSESSILGSQGLIGNFAQQTGTYGGLLGESGPLGGLVGP